MDVVATTTIRIESFEGSIDSIAHSIDESLKRAQPDYPAITHAEAEVFGPHRVRITIQFTNIADHIDDLEDWCRKFISAALDASSAGQTRGSLALVTA